MGKLADSKMSLRQKDGPKWEKIFSLWGFRIKSVQTLGIKIASNSVYSLRARHKDYITNMIRNGSFLTCPFYQSAYTKQLQNGRLSDQDRFHLQGIRRFEPGMAWVGSINAVSVLLPPTFENLCIFMLELFKLIRIRTLDLFILPRRPAKPLDLMARVQIPLLELQP